MRNHSRTVLRMLGVVGGLAMMMTAAARGGEEPGAGRIYGVLQGTVGRAAEGFAAGWRVEVVALSWDRLEPKEGIVNTEYVAEMAARARAFRALGYRLQLDLGVQYPPEWVLAEPHARYRNQYGQEYETKEPGKKMADFVFNAALREKLAAYYEMVFRELGTEWDWVRLGGGLYGEVNYPVAKYGGKTNAYWAYDELAQGKAAGLPEGLAACPVPGWKPGEPSPGHEAARRFAAWYLGALRNYHDWQIATVRRSYPGEICMLYGSWGIRPGAREAAVATDLNGSSPAEENGEIAAGYDWARMIGGIRDGRVIVYGTWLDAPAAFCDDDGTEETRWSPAHWLAALAARNALKLRVWGENTGGNTRAEMELTFSRVRRYGLMGVMWAFEDQLFAKPNPRGFATEEDYREMMAPER